MDPAEAETRYAALDVIETLNQLRFASCFIGGMACCLFCQAHPIHPDTRPRTAHVSSLLSADLDIFVLSTVGEAEGLKQRMVEHNRRLSLVRSKKKGATYKILWYRLPSGKQLKVDILFPGAMDLPIFPTNEIVFIDGLPVAPLSLMLVTKLQAWSQRRASGIGRYLEKIPTDRKDITALLHMARRDKSKILPRKKKSARRAHAYIPHSLILDTEARVAEFVKQYPWLRQKWAYQGFPVEG